MVSVFLVMTNGIRVNLVTLYGTEVLQRNMTLDKDDRDLKGEDYETP